MSAASRTRLLGATLLTCLGALGCQLAPAGPGELRFACEHDSDCAPGHRCVVGVCQPTGVVGRDAARRDVAGRDGPGVDVPRADASGVDAGRPDSGGGDSGSADHRATDATTGDAGAGGDRARSDLGAVDDLGAGADVPAVDAAALADAATADGARVDAAPADISSADTASVLDGASLDAASAADSAAACVDLDQDGRGIGCAAGGDCDDDDDSLWALLAGYADGDGDGVTQSERLLLCTDGTLPGGYLAQPSASADCDDGRADLWQLWTGYQDGDGDGATVGGPLQLCAGDSLPDGYAAQASALEDCDDGNASVGADGDLDSDGLVDCLDPDDDDDGLSDVDELSGAVTGFVTRPRQADSDGDGVLDGLDPAPLTAACHTALLFHDDFSTAPAGRWSELAGTWQHDAAAQTYRNSANQSGAVTWIGNRAWSDYVYELRLRPDNANHDPGIIFRAATASASNNGGNHYYLGLYPGSNTVTLGYMDGSWHPLLSRSATIDAAIFYTVRVELAGDRIQVFVDGTSVIDTTQSIYGSGGIGFRTYQNAATYDDVVVCQ